MMPPGVPEQNNKGSVIDEAQNKLNEAGSV